MKHPHQQHIELAVAYRSDKSFREKYHQLRKRFFALNNLTFIDFQMQYNDVQLNYDISVKTENIPLHSHAFTEILYCDGGSVGYLMDGKKFQISKGDLLFINPGAAHQPLFSDNLQYPYERYALWLSDNFIKELAEKIECIDSLNEFFNTDHQFLYHLNEEESYRVESIMKSIINEYKEEKIGWKAMINSRVTELIIDLCRIIINYQSHKKEYDNEDLVAGLVSYINTHLSEKITMDALSEQFYVSASTIYNRFMEKIGVSPYKFIRYCSLVTRKPSAGPGSGVSLLGQQSTYLCSRS